MVVEEAKVVEAVSQSIKNRKKLFWYPHANLASRGSKDYSIRMKDYDDLNWHEIASGTFPDPRACVPLGELPDMMSPKFRIF